MDDITFADTWPDRSASPLTVPWPDQGNPGAVRNLTRAAEWLDLIRACNLHGAVPMIVVARFDLAQKLYAYGWLEDGFVKAGELAAVVALELGLLDRYGGQIAVPQVKKRNEGPAKAKGKPRPPMLHDLLRHMVEKEGLTDSLLPSARLYGPVVSRLYMSEEEREARMGTFIEPPTTLVGIRNGLAHGDPYDGLPWGGLLELVRDLIEYAYRHMTAEALDHLRATGQTHHATGR